MPRQLFIAIGIVFCFGGTAAANDIVYTQNNLPRQHLATETLSQENPIIINAELLFGRLIPPAFEFAFQTETFNGKTKSGNHNYDNQNKFGFRVGVGVGLGDNDANLSLQYMRQTSGETNKISEVESSSNRWDLIFPYTGNGVARVIREGQGLQDGNFIALYDLSVRLQILDLIIQTAKWMVNEKIRFQPFGGGRYLNFRVFRKIDVEQNNQKNWGHNTTKLSGFGAFIGTDIRFIVSKPFHFFTNILTGILAGNETLDYKDNLPVLQTSSFTANDRLEITLNPFWEIRFGMQWSYIFNNGVLLSLRLAYEMLTMTHQNILSGAFRTSVIKTQLGSFGITIIF